MLDFVAKKYLLLGSQIEMVYMFSTSYPVIQPPNTQT